MRDLHPALQLYLAIYSRVANERGHEELIPELRGRLVQCGGNTMIAILQDVAEDLSTAATATRLLLAALW